MATQIEVVDKRSAALTTPEPADPILALMNRFAANESMSPEKIKALLDIYVQGQRQMQEMQDERAFAEAMADFKKNPPRIVKNRTAKLKGTAKGSGREYEFEYSYADLDEYCKEAMPMLAERGITWSFPFTEVSGQITVSCVLRYGLYTNSPTTLSGAPEGGSNALQAKGVTVAYLERYTFAGATGLTAAMPDQDGNPNAMAPDDVNARIQAIKTAPDETALMKVYSAALSVATKSNDTTAIKALGEAKNARFKELAKGASNA